MPKRAAKKIPTRAVRLEIFDIHGHNAKGALDYPTFFAELAGLASKQRRVQVANRVIAVPVLTQKDGIYTFNAYIGSPDTSFLVLDLNSDTEEVRQLSRGELLATRTVGTIDPVKRTAVIQYVHEGVRAAQIAVLFEKVAHLLLPAFALGTLEFTLRAGPAFRQQINALNRIHSATLTLTRPNLDWTDYSDVVNGIAGDSNARNIQVAASAPRDESLKKQTGLVRLIKELSKPNARSIMKSATVKGTSEATGQPVEVKLQKNIQSEQVRVPIERGLPDPVAVQNAATNVLGSLNAETT